MKTINRTIIKTSSTVEVFLRKEREQKTLQFDFYEKLSDDEVMKILYKKYEKGANEMPLFIHENKNIEYKYSMPLDFFIENAKLENVSE